MVKSVLGGEGLGATMKEGVISLLYKKGDRERLENYRPITLLCVDYKIVARVLVGRLKKALPHVIHEDQTCGVGVEANSVEFGVDEGLHSLGAGEEN